MRAWVQAYLWGVCAALHVQEQFKRCVDGQSLVDCDFDLAACAERAGNATHQKWAFVLTHDLSRGYIAPNPVNVKALTDAAKQHRNIDVVLIVPGSPDLDPSNTTFVRNSVLEDAQRLGLRVLEVPIDGLAPPRWMKDHSYVYHPLSDDAYRRINDAGLKIETTPVVVPNRIKQNASELHDPIHDFMKINAFSLDEYDAVVYYDNDVQLTGRGDVTQLFRCVSQNYFLTTTGPFDNLNAGFMAFKPSRGLAMALVNFAVDNDYDTSSGWAGLGFEPIKTPGFNQQIFYYTVFYKKSWRIDRAFDKAGASAPRARQLDRCSWNFQNIVGCDPWWDCTKVYAIHKDGWECRKSGPRPTANETGP